MGTNPRARLEVCLHAGNPWAHMQASAETAKLRLHGVVAKDRKACGDGKWVKSRDRDLSAAIAYYDIGRIDWAVRMCKDVYRWTVRR